jgi:methionyl-tRNA synthetase
VTTEKWAKYAREFVEQGLQDIPVTRANVKWGVQVPFDKEQTIYVWYDALANYYSYLHFEENEQQGFVEKFWPQSVHVVGKDIIKFHAILWPAMLKSAGYQPPKHVLCHGFFTVNGQKIGKSNSNAIHPVELADKYGVDAVRYALLSEFQVGNDGDFSFERLEAKYTADLANNWGNLLNRVIHLINTKDAKVEDEKAVSQRVKAYVDAKVAEYHEHFEHFRLFEACQIPNLVADWGNKYITERKPWEADTAEAQPTLNDLWYLLKNVNELYLPILPESAEKAVQALNKLERVILFPKLD